MKLGPGIGGVAPPQPGAVRAELKKLSRQFEGVFVRQLIAAMRESVPKDDPLASAGQEMFTNMFDDGLARLTAERMNDGLSEALYRQLSRGLLPEAGEAAKK